MSVTWAITKPSQDVIRMEATGAIPLDLNEVWIGDYINIYGTGFSIENRGSFEITNVEVFYVTGTLHQALEFVNPTGIAESATQDYNSDLQFFRPSINNIQVPSGRTVVVSSTTNNKLKVVIPATTAIVNRELFTAAYLHDNEKLSLRSLVRNKNGQVTAYYNESPEFPLAVGNQIYLEQIDPAYLDTFTVPATGAYTAASLADNITVTTACTNTQGYVNGSLVALENGEAALFGGWGLVASTPTINTAGDRFSITASSVVPAGTIAAGADIYTYGWTLTQTAGQENSKAVLLTSGTKIGQIFVSGGNTITDGNYNTGLTVSSPRTQLLDPATGVVSFFDVIAPTAGHAQVQIVDGRVLVIGGVTTPSTIDNTIQNRASTAIYISNANDNEFAATVGVPDYNLIQGRVNPSATTVQNGFGVLVTGGQALAIPSPADSLTLAKWGFDEDSGSNAADALGIYNLVGSGTTAAVLGTKVINGREFTQVAAHMEDNASAGARGDAVTALNGEWTVEFWSAGASGTYPGSMALTSDPGTGTIVSFGTPASEIQADNCLMSIYLSANTLTWRWERGAGTEVTGTTASFASLLLANRFNHFAVRKTSEGGGNYSVDVFVNGKYFENFPNVLNSDGGVNTSRFYVARDPEGTTGFTGVLDDIRISKASRSDIDILLTYFNSCGSFLRTSPSDSDSTKAFVGRLLNSCEYWNGTTVASVAPMSLARVFHHALTLPDGRVLVTGGLAYDPTNFTKDIRDVNSSDDWHSPSESTNIPEIYDPDLNKWYPIAPAAVRRHSHQAIYIPERDAVLVVGGVSKQIDGPSDNVSVIEMLDLKTMQWSSLGKMLPAGASNAVRLSNGLVLIVTSDLDGIGGTKRTQMVLNFQSEAVSGGGLNGFHGITEIGSGYFKFETPDYLQSTSIFGKQDNSSVNIITNGVRTSNITTITLGIHSLSIGEVIWVNFNGTAAFSSGLKTITAVGTTTVSYAEVAANQASVSVAGEVFVNFAKESSAIPTRAGGTEVVGPYVFDQDCGYSVTSIKTTIADPIDSNGQYAILDLASNVGFPDQEGWVIIGFGTQYQTKPIKYFGLYGSIGILLDFQHKFTEDIPLGTEIVLVTRESLNPELAGGLYATASDAGVVAAKKTIETIVAAGVDLDFDITYPGDRGLGAEGFPSEGEGKNSDQPYVFGVDE